jgi:hypothetical protein
MFFFMMELISTKSSVSWRDRREEGREGGGEGGRD